MIAMLSCRPLTSVTSPGESDGDASGGHGLEHRDALDVVGHREGVPGFERHHPVTALPRRLDVTGEGRGVAGDVDDAWGAQLCEQRHDILAGPGAWWVEHRQVSGPPLTHEGAQLAIPPVGPPLHVVEVLGVDDP